jgi:hypothetical protein
MIPLNGIAVHRVSQTPRLSNQDIISYFPTVRNIGSSRRHSNFASAGEPIPVFLLAALPRSRNPTISNTPARVSQPSTPLKFVGSSDSCPYRGLNTVLADEQEMDGVLLQAWRRKHTVVSRLPIYFPEHMIQRSVNCLYSTFY